MHRPLWPATLTPLPSKTTGLVSDSTSAGGAKEQALSCIGCTDDAACNFSALATIDDGSCFELDPPAAQSATQTADAITFYGRARNPLVRVPRLPCSIGHRRHPIAMAFEPFDQSVWVAHSNGEYGLSGGKEAPDFNSGQHHANNANWLLFDVYEDVLFESVEVHSEGGGPQTIEHRGCQRVRHRLRHAGLGPLASMSFCSIKSSPLEMGTRSALATMSPCFGAMTVGPT